MTAKIFRFLLTALLLCAALWLGKSAWDRYMESAWTRDGRIKADVVNIGADVAGTVTGVLVKDNQLVQQGDVLFVIDQARYSAALAQSSALLAAQEVERGRRSKEARRRAALDDAVISAENRESASFAADTAGAQLRAAQAARELARLNLERTVVRAPVSGYVTNLNVHVGDFAAVGAAKLAIIDSASYYAVGYFEETKLPLLKAGAPVELGLMGGGAIHADRAGGPRHQRHALGNGVEPDAHRHALRQPHPVEGGVDVGQQFAAGAGVAVGDAVRDAVDMAVQHGAAAHQAQLHRGAGFQQRQLGFLEVAHRVIGRAVDDGQLGRAHGCLLYTSPSPRDS